MRDCRYEPVIVGQRRQHCTRIVKRIAFIKQEPCRLRRFIGVGGHAGRKLVEASAHHPCHAPGSPASGVLEASLLEPAG